MLKWLKGLGGGDEKPDHPMYSVREAEKLLADLPETNPGKALEEVVGWVESVSQTPGYQPALRAEVLRTLEDVFAIDALARLRAGEIVTRLS